MSNFEFVGDWEFRLNVGAFAGFQQRKGPYASKDSEEPASGEIQVEIESELNDSPDPLPEQLAAIHYLLDHQQTLVAAIERHVFAQFSTLIYQYDLEEEPIVDQVKSPADVRKVIGIKTVHVQLPHKDGIAYLGFSGGCDWDEEHGIGFLMHKDRVVDFGEASDAFSTWKAYEDNGTLKQIKDRLQPGNKAQRVKPRLYEPHPKYGKLTPAQQGANEAYEYRLIEMGFNEAFIQLVESGKIPADGKTNYLNMTFIARACQFNNEELVRYLLSQNVKNLKGCIGNVLGHSNYSLLDELVAAGADIHATNYSGDTLIRLEVANLCRAYYQKSDLLHKEKIKNRIEWLIRKGADPYQKNKAGKDAFDEGEYLNPETQISLRTWLKTKWRNYQG